MMIRNGLTDHLKEVQPKQVTLQEFGDLKIEIELHRSQKSESQI